MGIEVTSFDGTSETWDRYVDRAPQSSIFHRDAVLRIFEGHTDATLHRLVGYKGEQVIGLFPVFEHHAYGVPMAFSPPPRLGIAYQGPVLLEQGQLKQRKVERRRRRFITGCLAWIEHTLDPAYVHIRTTPGSRDSRPFLWEGFDSTPRYTYVLDLERDLETIKSSFSKSLRRYLEPTDQSFEIQIAGEDGIRYIHDQMVERYDEQGKSYVVPLDMLLEFALELPDEWVKPYVCVQDGDFVGGIFALSDDETVYFQEGGGTPAIDYPVNDVLHWRLIQDAHERGLSGYDLSGANQQRLCRYKAKFNPTLETYYAFSTGSPLIRTAVSGYQRLFG